MEIFKCSECEKVTCDENGNYTIFLKNNAGALKISGAEILALASKTCVVIASKAQVTQDLIQKVLENIEMTETH